MRIFKNYQGMKATITPLESGEHKIHITDSKGTTVCEETVDSEDKIGGVLNKYGDGIWIEQAT